MRVPERAPNFLHSFLSYLFTFGYSVLTLASICSAEGAEKTAMQMLHFGWGWILWDSFMILSIVENNSWSRTRHSIVWSNIVIALGCGNESLAIASLNAVARFSSFIRGCCVIFNQIIFYDSLRFYLSFSKKIRGNLRGGVDILHSMYRGFDDWKKNHARSLKP